MVFCGYEEILKKSDEVIANTNLHDNLYGIEVDIPIASANLCRTEAFFPYEKTHEEHGKVQKVVVKYVHGEIILFLTLNLMLNDSLTMQPCYARALRLLMIRTISRRIKPGRSLRT